MNLTRYSPQLAQAFFLLVEQPAMLARIGAAWCVLALAAHAATWGQQPGLMLVALLLNALAFGAFGYHWQRFVALGEAPRGPLAVGVNLRVAAWALAYQMLLMAEAAPMPLIRQALAGDPNAVMYAQVGQQLFQVLIGGLFLLLPHIALHNKADGRPSLQEMVMGGGIAVGLGYVLANLPFLIATHLWKDVVVSLPEGLAAFMLAGAIQLLLSFAAVAVVSAYFALVWKQLRTAAGQ